MTAARYTRFTLRLAGGAGGRPGDPRPAASGRAPGVDLGGAATGPRAADWVDDWSGRLPPPGPDTAALDYRHPAAVALLERIGIGWEERDGGDTLVFWLAAGAEREAATAAALAGLAAQGDLSAEAELPGWDEAWKAFHRSQAIGRLFVRPPWSPPRPDLLDVVVDAAMAFGTGGHPTTRQCLEEIQLVAPGSLLDLGCGSGVVSLAARRLGFAPVWGVDMDPVAVAEAAANAARNGLDAAFSEGDAADPALPLPAADAIVANIALAPLVRLAGRFAAGSRDTPAAPRPRDLLLAGLLVSQREQALAAYPGFELAAARDDGEWLLLHLRAAS